MSDVRVRISAVKDRSFDVVFRSIEEQGRRAQKALTQATERGAVEQAKAIARGAAATEKAIAQGAARGANALARETKRGASAAESAMEDLRREVQGLSPVMDRATAGTAQFGREAKRSFSATSAEFNRMAREAERAMARVERAQRGPSAAERKQARRQLGRDVVGAGSRVLSSASGIARDIAAGAGVDISLANAVRGSVNLESRATTLSNSAYMPGQSGANGQRVNPRALIDQAKQVANETAYDPTKVLEGLQKFVAKTGDLETGRASLKDMAVLAKATGTELDDMVDAAGDVANGLGNTENKGAKVKAVMAAIAAQGKEGAVEIKDLAIQMAKLGAASGTFEGDPTKVIATMGALAQMSRAKGGSASATQAATSVSSFTNTFSKSARLNAFKAFGVNTVGEGGKVRDPQEVIVDAIKAASSSKNGGMKNFDLNMGKMFMDTRARSVTKGFETVYKEAGGGEAGIKAVRDAFERLSKATMQNTEIQESFRRAMGTTESQAQLVNNRMLELGTALKDAVLPAVLALGPALLGIANFVSELTGTKDKANQVKDADLMNQATNASHEMRMVAIRARRGEKNIPIADDVFEASAATEKSLEQTISERSAEAVKLRRRIPVPLGGTGEEGIGVGEDLNANVERMKQLDRQVSMDKEALGDLRSAQSGILSLLRDGIVIKKMPTPPTPTPAPAGVPPSNP